MIPLWLIRFGPYIAGALLAGLLVMKVYDAGVNSERAKWQAKEVAAQMALQEREDEMQAQVDASGVALSMLTEENRKLREANEAKRNSYYVQNPTAAAVVCLSDSRFLHHQESDRESDNSTPAGTSK